MLSKFVIAFLPRVVVTFNFMAVVSWLLRLPLLDLMHKPDLISNMVSEWNLFICRGITVPGCLNWGSVFFFSAFTLPTPICLALLLECVCCWMWRSRGLRLPMWIITDHSLAPCPLHHQRDHWSRLSYSLSIQGGVSWCPWGIFAIIQSHSDFLGIDS